MYIFFNPNRQIAENGLFAEFVKIISTNIGILLLTIFLLYFTRMLTVDVSRAIFGYFFAINSFLMYIFHLAFKMILTQYYMNSKSNRQLLVVCRYDDAFRIIRHITERSRWDYHIRGLIIIDGDHSGETIYDAPVVGNKDTLIEYCKKDIVDEILFFTDMTADNMPEILHEISSMGITVHLSIQSLNLNMDSPLTVSNIAEYPVITFAYRFMSFRQVLIKRIIDIIFSVIGSIVTLLLTIILGPIIKADSPGPIFFKQQRVGKNGRYFNMYKFRSMYVDAEERKKSLMEQNEMSNSLVFKMDNDPRITKVGAFLRKTSLDEFPQFFNILKGDMSLIGTRPPTVEEFKQYQSYHKMRLSIKPGLTGLWQVSGRSDITDFEEIVRLDVKYINEWSIALDIKIIFKTIFVVLLRKGAK
jgi:exopolysaccharide biosynthesis polyprenyl glycosylphosphotransferase